MRHSGLGSLLLALSPACAAHDAPPAPDTNIVVDTVASPETAPIEEPVAAYPLPGGRLAVVDYRKNQVHILAADGRLDTSLGRAGQGPGEFSLIYGIAFRAETLAVLDIGNGRLSNFVLGRGFLGTRPLPPGFAHQAFVLLPGDTTLHMTDGADGALVTLRAPDGRVLVRYGDPLVPPPTFFNLRTMKEAIAAGRIPDEFRNTVLPVLGPARDVWVIQQTTGVIEHYSPAGVLLGSLSLPAEHVRAREAEFFRANRALMNDRARLADLRVAAAAVATADRLWLLLAVPDSIPAQLLAIDTSHVIRERHELPGAAGAITLTQDTVTGAFYLVNIGEGVILRARRERARRPLQ